MAYFPATVQPTDHTTLHDDRGLTSGYTVRAGGRTAPRGAWQHIGLPAYASEPQTRTSGHRDRIVANTRRPVVLYESALAPLDHQTICPHKTLCSDYDGDLTVAEALEPRKQP
jgi:uncharacterized protein (DUF427 family)